MLGQALSCDLATTTSSPTQHRSRPLLRTADLGSKSAESLAAQGKRKGDERRHHLVGCPPPMRVVNPATGEVLREVAEADRAAVAAAFQRARAAQPAWAA